MNIDKWLSNTINNSEYPKYRSQNNEDVYGSTENKFRTNSNGYHTDILFRQIIDYTHGNDIFYKIYDPVTKDYVECDLFDNTMKDSFYQFCYENSNKTVVEQLPSRPIPIKRI